MKRKFLALVLGGLTAAAGPIALGQVPGAPGAEAIAAPGAEEGMQVLEQGPIHEAFAEPVVLEAAEQVLLERQPPEPINELPPDVRPEGNNVEWIPGYWMWSDQQQDFIWVSGVWRDMPPGRRWVPGHWTNVEGGYTWVSGFWANEQQHEVQMLPMPPETLEVGPSSPAPAANYFWVPGCWIWQNNSYAWRGGYWYAGQANWIWVPDHYSYTPYGATFVSGYWDYPLVNRGLLYAPVWWSRPIYNRPGYFYRPYSAVNTALLLTALFVNDRHHHYYYGYGNWRNNYYRPWYDHHHHGRGGHRHGYDPFYAYHRWHDGRNSDDWVDNLRRDFQRHQQSGLGHGGPRPGGVARAPGEWSQLVKPVNQLARNSDWLRVRQLSDAERQVTQRQVQNWQQVRNARRDALSNLTPEQRAQLKARAVGGQRGGDDRSRQVAGNQGGRGGAEVRTSFRLPTVDNSAVIRDRPGRGPGDRSQANRPGGQLNRGGNQNAQIGGQVGEQPSGRGNFQPRPRGTVADGAADGRGRSRDMTPQVVVPGARQNAGAVDEATRRRTFEQGRQSGRTVDGDAAARQARENAAAELRRRAASEQGSQARPDFRGRVEGNTQVPGRSFRYDGGSRSIQVPSGTPRTVTPRTVTPRTVTPRTEAPRSIQIPSGGGEPRSIRVPSSSGRSQSFRVPSGGGQPSFRGPSGGGGQPSFRGSSGGESRPSFRPSPRGGGGESSFRGAPSRGGGGEMRGGGGGGGRGNASRGGGGGGGGRGRDRD